MTEDGRLRKQTAYKADRTRNKINNKNKNKKKKIKKQNPPHRWRGGVSFIKPMHVRFVWGTGDAGAAQSVSRQPHRPTAVTVWGAPVRLEIEGIPLEW